MATYDQILQKMLEKSSAKKDSNQLQRDIDQLTTEIDALAEAARLKELEWNNILYLKKMKEDMLVRLNRKKTVMEIMSTKIIDEPENLLNVKTTTGDDRNKANHNNNNSNTNLNEDVTLVDCNGSFSRKDILNAIAPNASLASLRCSDLAKERSNMNSSDLAKEKSNISKLHR